MYDRIVVGTDGSSHARAGIEHARSLAAAHNADVHVITVVNPRSNPMKFGVEEIEELSAAKELLIDDLLESDSQDMIEISGEVRRGRPSAAILDFASEIDADLIIVGQRGADGVTAALIGSTADRLTRLSTIPVLVVPSSAEDS